MFKSGRRDLDEGSEWGRLMFLMPYTSEPPHPSFPTLFRQFRELGHRSSFVFGGRRLQLRRQQEQSKLI